MSIPMEKIDERSFGLSPSFTLVETTGARGKAAFVVGRGKSVFGER